MKRLGRAAAIALAVAIVWTVAVPTAAEELVIDLSEKVVGITTAFAGSSLLLFGATEGEGDVVVAVRGPMVSERVRRKERILGVWINQDETVFEFVPSFYSVAASRPLEDILSGQQRINYQIGVTNLRLRHRGELKLPEDPRTFREALLRNKQRDGLYGTDVGRVDFIGKRLFRTQIHFPTNVPVGTYRIDVYLARDQAVVNVKKTLLDVRKVGFEAEVYDFAHRHAMAYGVLAILIAAMAGWLAGAVFRKQ